MSWVIAGMMCLAGVCILTFLAAALMEEVGRPLLRNPDVFVISGLMWIVLAGIVMLASAAFSG